jgi:hypothetical protein
MNTAIGLICLQPCVSVFARSAEEIITDGTLIYLLTAEVVFHRRR